MGVHTRMRLFGEWSIVPPFSWYCVRFYTDDRGDAASLRAWGDYRFYRWPPAMAEPDIFLLGSTRIVRRILGGGTCLWAQPYPLGRNHGWGALSAASVGLSAGTARPGIYPGANRLSDYS